MQRDLAKSGRADFLITHTHWDTFTASFLHPAFIRGNEFTFHTPFADLPDRLARQQDDTFFPVPISYMSATLKFKPVVPDEWHQIGNFASIHPRLASRQQLRLPH